MALQYRAAVLHAPKTPQSVETVTAASLKPTDVPVRMNNDGFAALKRLAHSCQIGRGGLMAEPVTALLVSSPTVLRACRRRVFAAHQAAALTITRTLTHGHLG